MANVNAPFGFRPVRHLNGSPYNGQGNIYVIPSTDTSAYYIGDPVKSVAYADAFGVPGVQKAAGTDTVRGVIVGILPIVEEPISMVGTTLTLEQVAISTTSGKARDYYVLVADAPDLVFEVQGDSSTAFAAATMNKNTIFTVAAPSTATNPLSASVLAGASLNTTNTLNVKVLGLVRDGLNAFGAYAKVYAMFNLHELSASGTTAI